jgi:hypothetical protein
MAAVRAYPAGISIPERLCLSIKINLGYQNLLSCGVLGKEKSEDRSTPANMA